MKITLPFPAASLNPNKRLHWAVKAKAAKAYRAACWAIALENIGTQGKMNPPISMNITFHPPDKRRRDNDNLVASFKAGQDGIADALGVDDVHFVQTYRIGDKRDTGAVEVEIIPADMVLEVIGGIS